jgi:ketosteroid isomerase-like protein
MSEETVAGSAFTPASGLCRQAPEPESQWWPRAAGCFVVDLLLAALTGAEAEAVASLHRLNAELVCAFARSDASWCDAYLSDDFVCTLADGRRLDRGAFLALTAEHRDTANVTCEEVDVRPLGELQLGLVHGVSRGGYGDAQSPTRFTHVWLVRDDRWQLVAAQLTQIQ